MSSRQELWRRKVDTPRGLTDMELPDYNIDEEKARYRNMRKARRNEMLRQAQLDEDGKAFKQEIDRSLLSRLFDFVLPYRWGMLGAIGLLLLYSALVPAFPTLLANAIDRFIVADVEPYLGFTIDERLQGLLNIVLIYMGLRAANFVLRFAYTYLISWLGQRVIYDIRDRIFSKIQRLHMGFFDRTPSGRLLTRVTSDVDAIQQAMTDGMVGLVADIALMTGLLVYMFVINWQLALIVLAIMPLLYVVLNFITKRLRNAFRAVRLRVSQSNTYLAENLSGMKTVQMFNREERNARQFDRINLDLLDAHIEQVRWFSMFWPIVGVGSAIATAAILYYAMENFLPGSGITGLTIGTLVAFIQFSGMFFRPLQNLSDKFNIIQAAMASAERIFDLLDTKEGIVDKENPVPVPSPFQGKVEFENVWFSYGDGEKDGDWVLRDVSFTIEPGESVAFVGHTGAGKTTVISLLSRFYDIQRGSIKIDGIDIREFSQADLRKHVGIVLQDPFLFSGTVLSNITLGDKTISRQRVVEAAKFVNAHHFIERMPQGYDTEVRERGAGFSTGQKQLIAFARALVQNPEILLILDEATANVDTETEELIQDALAKLMDGRTSILIAHRLSTIQNSDHILVMRKGELIEKGNHQQLLEHDGYYRKLYELQYQGQQD